MFLNFKIVRQCLKLIEYGIELIRFKIKMLKEAFSFL